MKGKAGRIWKKEGARGGEYPECCIRRLGLKKE
jgi:hypothetical protein